MTHTTTYRQKDNGWQIIISYKDTDGKWHQKSKQGFPTKRDAKEFESDLIRQIKNRPQPVEQGMVGITLEKFCEVYTKNKKSITAGTISNYIYAVKALGWLAKKPVRQITYMDLQTVVSGWNTKPQTQKQYMSKLVVLFNAAVKPYHIISTNPIEDVEIEKVRQQKAITVISSDQFKEIMSGATGYVRMALLIAWYTGVRRGELSALKWKDIDLTGATITVRRQAAKTNGRYIAVTETTKSRNGFRTIPIPAMLVKELKQYRKTYPIPLDGNLFQPVSMYNDLYRWLKRHHGIKLHSFRHTYATRLLAEGVDVQTVAALLGDNVQTVIHTYIHYSDNMRAAAAKSIEKIFCENF